MTTSLPPTRIISFLQQVIEADPSFYEKQKKPVQYEFSSGRTFIAPFPLYGTNT